MLHYTYINIHILLKNSHSIFRIPHSSLNAYGMKRKWWNRWRVETLTEHYGRWTATPSRRCRPSAYSVTDAPVPVQNNQFMVLAIAKRTKYHTGTKYHVKRILNHIFHKLKDKTTFSSDHQIHTKRPHQIH